MGKLKKLAGAIALGLAQPSERKDEDGRLLVYPFYKDPAYAEARLVSVLATTERTKAVKVRFVEGGNSAEVLDFNLFLSPRDVWTGAVIEGFDVNKGRVSLVFGKSA